MRLKMPQPLIFRTLDSVLAVLRNHQTENAEAVNSLLDVYTKTRENYTRSECETRPKHPLIVLEGLDGCGKSTVGFRLAKKLNATQWCTPPKCIHSIRDLFDADKELRTAYYALGNYIAALEVAVVLKDTPVIMDRYWYSTCAFAIAQAVHDYPEEVALPEEKADFYNWPGDLLTPNCVLFLNVRENVRIMRISKRPHLTTQERLLRDDDTFRNNIIKTYERFISPEVVFIDGTPGFSVVLRAISSKIGHLVN